MISGIHRPDKIGMKSIQDAEMSKNIGQGGGGGKGAHHGPLLYLCSQGSSSLTRSSIGDMET